MADRAAIIIAAMKPSDRITGRPRRLIAAMAACLAAHAAAADDLACRITTEPDPRLEELLRADPDDPRIDITSDQGELGRAGDASLSGNVRIRMGQRLLTADKAEIDAEQRSVRLEGTVEYLDPTLHVRGQGGSFAAGAGEFEGAQFELKDRGVRGAARDVRLRGESVLDLEGVRYTACPPGNDDWKLRAEHISIDQQTRIGTGSDVKLEFMGATILYAPWITFPVGDVRKSGFLFPTIGSGSKTGAQIAVPYYWNIAPNYDATLTTRYYSSRGLRLDPEFRYLTRRSEGIFNTQYLFEDLEDGGSRSLVDLRHVTRLQPTTRLLLDAAHASDDQYFEDFGVGFEGTSITFLDRLAEARHDTAHWSLVGRVRDYQILDPDLADPDQPYSILPQVTATGRWRNFAPGLSATVHGEAANFDRDTGVTGVRVDVEPSLEWRGETRASYLAASAAWRATSYSLTDADPGVDESPLRTVPTLSVDTGLVLERTAGTKGNRLQTLEPRALFLYVPYRDQDDLPVFDSGLPDLNLVQLFRTNRYVGGDQQAARRGGRPAVPERDGRTGVLLRGSARAPSGRASARSQHLGPGRGTRTFRVQALERSGRVPVEPGSFRDRAVGVLPPVPAGVGSGRQRRLPLPPGPARTSRRVGRLADRRPVARLRPLGLLARRGEDPRPVRRVRVLIVLLGLPDRHPPVRQQPHRRHRHLDRPAAGTEGPVQCRSGQRSFPARSDSWILRAPVRGPPLICH